MPPAMKGRLLAHVVWGLRTLSSEVSRFFFGFLVVEFRVLGFSGAMASLGFRIQFVVLRA